jgi:hypothetical protein
MKFSFTIEDGHLKKYNAPSLDCDAVATVPEGVSAIDASAFYYIRGLDRVELPESVREIGEEAFYMCEGMRSFGMPSRLECLGARAFAHCHSLESIVIPEGVGEIYENTFYRCERLGEVYLPRSLTDVQPGAFYGCYLLTRVYYAGTKAEWEHVRAGALIEKDVICLGYDESERRELDPDNYTVEDGVLIGYCGEEATVFLPEGVHTVGSGSFNGLYRLFTPMHRLVLHEGVTRVEAGALCQEDHLSEIVIPKSLCEIPEGAISPAKRPIRVIYRGTRAEWEAVKDDMHVGPIASVTCVDGEYPL